MLKKFFVTSLLGAIVASSPLAAGNTVTGVVNFSNCVTDSKYGKHEQENFESLRKQMGSMIEGTENQLKEISAKFEDTEYLDSLSPKAEEELKTKFQSLQEELSRYQSQFYQVLQHANHQMVQKISQSIATAAQEVAKAHNLDYVMNKEALFYTRPDLDVTNEVIAEMNKSFDLNAKEKKLSENDESPQSAIDAFGKDQAR